jgi:hypothetical protein
LTAYLDDRHPTFTGAYFATFGSNPPDEFAMDDLAALSLLDVPPPRNLVLTIGLTRTAEFNRMLRAVPSDTTLWGAERPAIEALDALWPAWSRCPGIVMIRAARRYPNLTTSERGGRWVPRG